MLSLLVWPKVIKISGFHCIKFSFLPISVKNVKNESKRVSSPDLNPSDVVREHAERHEDGLHLGGHLDRRHGLHRCLLLQDLVSHK